jgi:hypothetical protein
MANHGQTAIQPNKGEGPVKRPHLLVPTFVALILVSLPAPGFAQETTPAATDAGASGQMRCTAEPRNIDELLAFWFDEAGNPAPTPTMAAGVSDVGALPQGEPVDAATFSEIDETTRGWVACFIVTGQYARGFSFMTDELAAMFGPDTSLPDEDTAEEVRALLEAQLAGTPIAGEAGLGAMPNLEGPNEARMLADGRIGALWALEGDQVFIVYEKQGDRWLIADFIDVLEASATPAS